MVCRHSLVSVTLGKVHYHFQAYTKIQSRSRMLLAFCHLQIIFYLCISDCIDSKRFVQYSTSFAFRFFEENFASQTVRMGSEITLFLNRLNLPLDSTVVCFLSFFFHTLILFDSFFSVGT